MSALQPTRDWLRDIQCLALSWQSLAALPSSVALRCCSPVTGLWSVPHGQAGAAPPTFLRASPVVGANSEAAEWAPRHSHSFTPCQGTAVFGGGTSLLQWDGALSLFTLNATAPS